MVKVLNHLQFKRPLLIKLKTKEKKCLICIGFFVSLIAKARAYQKSHETFEGVVQNTYTNAEKLLAAAAELAQTGECNAEDIYSVAHELESHISSFAQRVEQRRRLLELSVLFYSHTEELTNWLNELRVELQSEEVAETLEGAERLLEQFGAQRDSTLDACASTIAEGKTLLDELKSNNSQNTVNICLYGDLNPNLNP